MELSARLEQTPCDAGGWRQGPGGVRVGRPPHATFKGFSFYKRLALLSETRDVFLLRSRF